jgi:hypothetical protein
MYYSVAGQPEMTSKRVVKDVFDNNCTGCGQRATCRLTVRHAAVEIVIGKRLLLDCRGQGQPTPRYSWFKDNGTLLTSNKALKITTYKRGSKLVIAKVKEEDSGTYACRTANVFGSSQTKPVQVVIKSPTTPKPKSHSELCSSQDFCFNGGTCFILSNLKQQYCQCPSSVRGNRCQEKFLLPPSFRKSTDHDRLLNPGTTVVLVLMGSVILFTLSVAMLVTAVCILKSKCCKPPVANNPKEPAPADVSEPSSTPTDKRTSAVDNGNNNDNKKSGSRSPQQK